LNTVFNRNMKKINEFLDIEIEIGDLVKSVHPSMSSLLGVVADIEPHHDLWEVRVKWNNNEIKYYSPDELIVLSGMKESTKR
jgi:hypothetical protein